MSGFNSFRILALTVVVLLGACAPASTRTATPLPAQPSPTTLHLSVTPTSPPPLPTATSISLVISSSAFQPGGEIPERYGFFRENASPPLRWTGVPEGTKSLALLIEDRDTPFHHWVVYNIPADATGLPEGGLPAGTLEGLNTNGEPDYAGPYPPPAQIHTYAFILYALDVQLGLGPGATQEQVVAAMEGHILAEGELLGKYLGVEP